MGLNCFTMLDLRLRHQLSKTTRLAADIDKFTGERHWDGHRTRSEAAFSRPG